MRRSLLALFSVCTATGCGAPIVKPDAFAQDVLEREPLPASLLEPAPRDEIRLVRDPAWLSAVDPLARPTFAGLRRDGVTVLCAVLACVPDDDLLVLAPLGPGETALDVLASPSRTAEIRAWAHGSPPEGALRLSLRTVYEERLLDSPLPPPAHVFGVGANFPSHLQNDLRIGWTPERRAALAGARARVFLKHPPTAPPGYDDAGDLGFTGMRGPFDSLVYPEVLALPADDPDEDPVELRLRLDYECEIGAVIGRELTPESIATLSDAELRAAVAGYVLAGDTKARNPQVIDRLRHADREPPPESAPYRPANDKLAKQLDFWDPETCAWWSYAASFGDFTTLGPFLVAAPEDGSFPAWPLITARSYATEEERGAAPPRGREAGELYLRQASQTAESGHPDALVWSIPDVLRSILADDGVIPFPDGRPRLLPGDVVCLGTPGGTVTTARKGTSVLRTLLFWWAPSDWHDAFFGADEGLYLRNGDEVLYWAGGLGCQLHRVELRDER